MIFIDKKISRLIKSLRPKKYINRTVWIESNIEDLYSYKNFIKNFLKTHTIDYEKKIHSVFLYIIWAEKCYFLKRNINLNFFNSKCFYWIDAGFFRKPKKIIRYLNNWPSPKKCFEDPRTIINSMRNLSATEINGLKNLNITIYNKFRRKSKSVAGGFFGGNSKYLLKFILLYYKTIKLFIKKDLFIGKDQNLFSYIAYSNKDIIKIIYSGNYYYFASYLSEK